MNNLKRIQQVSQVLRLIITFLLLAIPVGTIFYWLTFNDISWPLPQVLEQFTFKPYPSTALVLGFLVTLIPVGLVMFGLLQLRKLFALYRKGEVFSRSSSSCLMGMGIALVAWLPAGMTFDALISYLITMYNGPSQGHVISIGIHGQDLTLLLIGVVFMIIAWVMGEANALAEDQAQII